MLLMVWLFISSRHSNTIKTAGQWLVLLQAIAKSSAARQVLVDKVYEPTS